MGAPGEIYDLVERFERNLDAYKSGDYNETQARGDFIDPLMGLLGWDVHNHRGKAPAYRDVIEEDRVKVGGGTKAPDYGFYAGGTRRFFLEAKKPSVDIRGDVNPAVQLRRYAWSARLPLSILTDFEEFAVYDCRFEPVKEDKPATARLDFITFDRYPDRWDDIEGLFSREAVLDGSLERYAEANRKRRGTETVDAAFLREIEGWRDALARDLAARNDLNTRQLNYAVQMTIDRLIFLRMAEDRGIEEYGRLLGLANGSGVYGRLVEQFRAADDRYDSGLFHFRNERGRGGEPDDLTPNLEIDDGLLGGIVRGLYYPESPYEFSVLPVDVLGQVYEQFLGSVIHLEDGHTATVEQKPEVRKAGGVYYTPTYIVDYIVGNTVGRLLEGKRPGPRGGVSRLKIVDPACGSGSFLIGAYEYLLDWHRDRYLEDGPEKWSKQLYEGPGGQWHLTIDEKKRILLNNIHGVDIDPQAVEVTKLSLLIKVLEGESEQSLQTQLRMFHERALPDLSANIKCGNSLIGPDFYDNEQMVLLDEEEHYRINVFDWQSAFPQVFEGDDPGFEAVIGNPPYVVFGKDLYSEPVAEYLGKYEVAQYKTDLFHLMIQKGIDTLSSDGVLGYIVPNPWFTLKHTDQLRRYILEHTEIAEVFIFEHLVFQAANVHTALLFLEKRGPRNKHEIVVKRSSEADWGSVNLQQVEPDYISQESWYSNEGFRFETRLVGEVGELILGLLEKLPSLSSKARASLGSQAYNSSKHSHAQIANRVFHAKEKLSDEYLLELRGKDVGRYKINTEPAEWIKYGPWLHDYRTMDWLQGPRILVREITGEPPYQIQASYTEKTYCNYKTVLNVSPSERTDFSMKYLLGLLNSRLVSFIYPYMSNKIVAQSFPRLSVGDLRKIPIRAIDFSDPEDAARHEKMVGLVERMLELHEKLAEAKIERERTVIGHRISATDKQIDDLVYELYGLTGEEIRIVEEATAR